MLERHDFTISIILFLALLISACSSSKEVTKSKEFLDAGMYEQASILLKQEVIANPKNAEAHMLLGAAYLGSGSPSLADQEFNTALVMDSSLKSEASKRCFDIGNMLSRMDKAKANVAFRKAKEFDPNLEKDEQFFFLANIETEQNEPARIVAAKEYLTSFPFGANSAQATYEVANGLKASGDTNQAKIYFKQLVSQFAGTEWSRKASDHLANWIISKVISVDARRTDWTDTGIKFEKGDVITINASGTINHGGPNCGADGNMNITPDGDAAVPAARFGALVGKIDSSEPFVIGADYRTKASEDGSLWVLVNDTVGGYNDNSGHFRVEVRVKRNIP